MSFHVSDSEIHSIGPEGTEVSHDTCTVIRRALEFGELSEGFFDITIAPVVELWGFGSEQPAIPSASALDKALSLVDYRGVKVSSDCIVSAGQGQKIDLGGIAKGYAADQAALVLKESGVQRGIINLGGNVLVVGSKKDGSSWKIGIQDPFQPTGDTVGIMEIRQGAVVTSGIYERYFEENGRRYHHILDPETGYPAENDLAGVSISVSTSLDADALSTTVFLLGIDKGCSLLDSFPGSGAVFITRKGDIITYGSASTDFRLTSDRYEILERR